MFTVLLSAFSLSLAVQAGAQVQAQDAAVPPTPPAAQTAGNETAGDGSERICSMQRRLGSNIQRRVCFTRDEMTANEEASRQLLERMQPVMTEPLGPVG